MTGFNLRLGLFLFLSLSSHSFALEKVAQEKENSWEVCQYHPHQGKTCLRIQTGCDPGVEWVSSSGQARLCNPSQPKGLCKAAHSAVKATFDRLKKESSAARVLASADRPIEFKCAGYWIGNQKETLSTCTEEHARTSHQLYKLLSTFKASCQ